jgi:hypothetical protein
MGLGPCERHGAAEGSGRCWCGWLEDAPHEHMCGAGLGGAYHPGYLLPTCELLVRLLTHLLRRPAAVAASQTILAR